MPVPSAVTVQSLACTLAAIVAFGILLPYCLQHKDCTVVDTFNVVSVVPNEAAQSNCTMIGHISSSPETVLHLKDALTCLIIQPGQSFSVCYSAFGESVLQVPPFTPGSLILVMLGSTLSVLMGVILILAAFAIPYNFGALSARCNHNVIA